MAFLQQPIKSVEGTVSDILGTLSITRLDSALDIGLPELPPYEPSLCSYCLVLPSELESTTKTPTEPLYNDYIWVL